MSENENYKVYKHTTPEGKIYIGITGKPTVEGRWNKGSGYRGQYFYEAVKEFGWENIEHKTLIHGLTKKQADRWEIKLIAHYKSNNEEYGYNETKGGDYISFDSRKKVINVDTGIIYDSMEEAGIENSADSSKISMCCSGLRKSAGGYRWMKLENWEQLNDSLKEEIKNTKLINKYCIKEIIEIKSERIFKNAKDASIEYNINSDYISSCCRGERCFISNGMKFMFLEDWNNLTQKEKDKIKEKKYISNNHKKPVRCITTGQIFSSVQEASEFFNMKRQAIRDYCRKLVKCKKGLEFEFIDI